MSALHGGSIDFNEVWRRGGIGMLIPKDICCTGIQLVESIISIGLSNAVLRMTEHHQGTPERM